ncbi:TPA: hypothetical protein NJ089_004646 [Vibrio parahaemolyticus]|nr:hypothetical protein [Vibrio parahaemolyticus]HCE1814205.1 hypothetical protein [Vibrio parahaemolyticus]HCE3152811.1 hypothetical protein [Vibrio parahaemolyticus]HCG6107543.1 hypothetical protein [Vibrio parahaemolyticus]HCG6112605.1 hypothetical protein [Vibrio parahaemolyticus]
MKTRTEITEDIFDCCYCEEEREHIETAEYEEREDNGMPYEETIFWQAECKSCGLKRWQYEDCPQESNFEELNKNPQHD